MINLFENSIEEDQNDAVKSAISAERTLKITEK